MAAAVEHLSKELSGVRTGRANPGLLENIPVDAYGEKLPLKACGTVTVRTPQLLAISVYDQGVGVRAGPGKRPAQQRHRPRGFDPRSIALPGDKPHPCKGASTGAWLCQATPCVPPLPHAPKPQRAPLPPPPRAPRHLAPPASRPQCSGAAPAHRAARAGSDEGHPELAAQPVARA
jgi:hypothetical protein